MPDQIQTLEKPFESSAAHSIEVVDQSMPATTVVVGEHAVGSTVEKETTEDPVLRSLVDRYVDTREDKTVEEIAGKQAETMAELRERRRLMRLSDLGKQ